MRLSSTICLIAASLFPHLYAQDVASKRVEFAEGASSITLKGEITGKEAFDYRLAAKAGQTMNVAIESATPSQCFNILAPGGGAALHVGSKDGATFSGKLPADGEYTIRLYLLGNVRDTGATVAHTLKVSISGEAMSQSDDFDKTLSLQGITFRVMTARDEKGAVHLRVTPEGLEKDNTTADTVVEGAVTGVEVGDLNVDGSPEIYVFSRGTGENPEAALHAWATNNKRSMTPIFLAPLSHDAVNSKGYRGDDEFAVVENVVARRFPIYSPDGSVTEPTGKTRQLQYKLKAGEAGWVLKLDKVVEY